VPSSLYWVRFVLGLALILFSGCATGSFFPQKTGLPADRIDLPTEKIDDQLWVTARINGAGPFKLLVDTGCSVTLLGQHVVDTAGLKPLPKWEITMVNAAGVKEVNGAAWVERLECGGLTLEEFAVVVESNTALAAISALYGRQFDGAIGMETLKALVLEMDFRQGQVSVVRPGATPYPADRAIAYTGTTPRVKVTIDGQEIPIVIDTGKSGEFGLPKLDGISLLHPKTKATGAGAVFGKTSGKRDDVGQLAGEAKLGPITWVNPPVSGRAHAPDHGLLGVHALNTWKLVFDQTAQRVYFLGDELTRAWPKTAPEDARFAAGFFAEIEGDGLRLTEVDEGGAADLAGLKAGDLILEIDGSPAVRPEWKDYRSKLRVQRGGTEFETRLVSAPDYGPRRTLLAADRVALPTSSNRGALLIEARINGTGPFRFLVSSGSRPLLVAPHVVDAAKLKPLPDWKVPAATAKRVVWVEDFESGGLDLRGLAAVVSTLHPLPGIDGVVGMEALRDVTLETDFPRKQVAVVKPGTERFAEDRSVPYHPDTRMPYVNLDVAGRSELALIDTGTLGGFGLTVLDAIPLLHPKIKVDTIGYTKSVSRIERGQLAGAVKLGPITWVNPPIITRRNAQIGVVPLAPWRLVFDAEAHKVYFLDGPTERKAREVKPTPMSPLKPGYFLRLETGGLRVVEVDAGGAFDAAGLRASDLILSIDGMPATDFIREVRLFTANKSKPQKLRVQRDGAEFEATLILAPETPAE
jgi:S1-C subfamily serine protease